MPNPIKLALALSLLLPTIACDLDALPTSDRAGFTADDGDGRQEHRRPGPPPPVVLLEQAVERGDLHDDATMTAALAGMDAAHEGALAARDGLRLALADAVAGGAVRRAEVADELATIEQAARAEGEALTVALDTAHALLDAELRAEVVEALPEPPPAHAAGQAPPSGPRPSGDEQGQPPPPPGAGPGPEALLEALALDEEQRAALKQALGEPVRPQPPEPLDLALFAEDDFQAASLGLSDLHATHVTGHATRHVELLTVLVPLLDDGQRAALEELLRDAPPEPTRSARG